MVAGNRNLDDLYQFDPANMIWMYLSGTVIGTSPLPRISFGMAAVGHKLYIFAGSDTSGAIHSAD